MLIRTHVLFRLNIIDSPTTDPNNYGPIHSGPTSYAKVIGEPSRKSVNFGTIITPAGNRVYVAIALESIRAISQRFGNTTYGFFLGKRVAYPVVANYVRNTWGKYGLVKSMLNSSIGLFCFQFSSMDSLDSMLENGLWSSYVRAIIELQVDVELKDTIVDECPKNIGSDAAKNLKNPSQASRGVPVGHKVGFKPVKQVYRPVSKNNNANTSCNKKRDAESRKEGTLILASKEANSSGPSFWNVGSNSTSTAPIVEKIDKLERLIIDGKLTLVDDEGKPLKKVDYPGDHDSEDEVELVDNEMTSFLASKRVGYSTNSLLEQWRETYEYADYDYDPYDDDMYEGHKILDNIQSICDNLDIKGYCDFLPEEKLLQRIEVGQVTQIGGIVIGNGHNRTNKVSWLRMEDRGGSGSFVALRRISYGLDRTNNSYHAISAPTPDEVLRELCDKNYHQLLPLIAEKMQKEKEQQDKLNAVKARLLYGNETRKNQRNHEESHYSESKTPTARIEPKRRHGNRRSRSPSPVASVFKRLKQNRPPSSRPRPRKEGGVFNRGTSSQETGGHSESEDNEGGHWKSKSRRHRTRMPSHVKTYDESGDPKDHLKLFQAAAKTERWAMPTWCHMFNSTLTGNARDPVEIHHIKQRDGESTEDFMERYKAEILDVEGAPECMKISGFMYGITHLELIKRLYEKIPRLMDKMYRVTTSFLHGEVAAFSHSQKKAPAPWKQPDGGNKPNFKKGFKNKQRSDRKPNRFSLLMKTPKEIFALEKGKFKAPPPMVTPAEKRDPNKYYEFHADTGHSTDECMQLRKQIDEMIKSGKLSQFIKELKQSDKPKEQKKGETARKDKPLAILMIQPWERVAKQRVTQSFYLETIISFPSLGEED
ncbi:hypothetical protein Tco_0427957 [Tanacetum coccineum]